LRAERKTAEYEDLSTAARSHQVVGRLRHIWKGYPMLAINIVLIRSAIGDFTGGIVEPAKHKDASLYRYPDNFPHSPRHGRGHFPLALCLRVRQYNQ
jgi:hypothetical protein